jgi:hypothetical protein
VLAFSFRRYLFSVSSPHQAENGFGKIAQWFMPRGMILVDYTDQGRRTIKDSPDRANTSKAEAAKLGAHVKDLFV